jgi:short-subunit dehydrogenase
MMLVSSTRDRDLERPEPDALEGARPVAPLRAATAVTRRKRQVRVGTFKGKNVWIIGASSGIGESLAVAFAREGARLLLSARREGELARVAESCRKHQATADVLSADLCDWDGLKGRVELARAHFDAFDVVVFASGVSQRSLVEETSFEVYRRLMDINYFGPVFVTNEILPGMIQHRKGHLVVLSSLAGKFGTPMRSGYSASKHALHGYYESLRAEVSKHGIDVSIVCPGYIRTSITLNSLTGDGSPYGKVDEALQAGMPADECARIILENLRKKKEEFTVGRGVEMYSVYLKRFTPSIFSRIIRGHTVK